MTSSSESLLILWFGPVQGFIASARRTRDLWYGSHLLSEVARAAGARAAEVVAESEGGTVLSPPWEHGHCEWGPISVSYGPSDRVAVSNKVWVVVGAETSPETVAEEGVAAAKRRLMEMATDDWTKADAVVTKGYSIGMWCERIVERLETEALWVRLDGGVKASREELESALASRRGTQLFASWPDPEQVYKSSLDGAGDTCLPAAAQRNRSAVARFRIDQQEHLDPIGLLKRVGGEPAQFLPIATVALAPWIESALAGCDQETRDTFDETTKKLSKHLRVHRPDLPATRAFPYDGELLLSGQRRALQKECDDLGLTFDIEEFVEASGLSNLEASAGAPEPYVACIVADGDSIGSAISQTNGINPWRGLSESLSTFSRVARTTVEQDHRGSCVYAGGDELLGFVSVAELLLCVDSLRRSFERLVKIGDRGLSMSIGVAIVHVLTDMSQARRLAWSALELAKRQRNSLGIVAERRAGARIAWACSWGVTHGHDGAVDCLTKAMKLMGDRDLSSVKMHEIGRLLLRFPDEVDTRARDGALEREACRAFVGEARRIVDRNDAGKFGQRTVWTTSGLQSLENIRTYVELRAALQEWSHRTVIARILRRGAVTAAPKADAEGVFTAADGDE